MDQIKPTNRIVLLALLPLLTFLLSSCSLSQKANVPDLPDMGIAIDALNKDIEIFTRPSRNTFKVDDDIVVDMHLKSNIEVKSDASFNTKLYILDEKRQTWIEVQNLYTTRELCFGIKAGQAEA